MFLEQQSYEVLGLGAACVDLFIPVSEDFLVTISGQKGGAQEIDLDELNRIIEETGIKPSTATGGSCANTIKGLASLQVKCALLSKIGCDTLGAHFTQYMKNLGVVPLFLTANKPTARVLCLITPDGQRTMRFFAGSSQEMDENHLHTDYLKGVKIVHIDSYSLRNGQLIERMMQLAKEAGALISIDLSSFEIVHQYKERIYHLLRTYVDIVFANEDETKTLTGLSPYQGCEHLKEICPIAIVLSGKDGCLVGHQKKIFESPAFPANVIDTTGAGDLFASGFLYGYLKGYPLEKCARLGNLLGGSVIEVKGAEIPEEKWKELRQIISKE
jgi:sugar/nucleoside kinase (ribokinase family)